MYFADSAQPDRIPAEVPPSLLPPGAPLERLDHLAAYSADCDFPIAETDPDYARRWSDRASIRWITFSGARRCSIADYEPHTEVYNDTARLRTWAAVRHRGHLGRSIVYSDLSDVWKAQQALQGNPVSWWLATEGEGWKTALELSQLLARVYGVTLHPDAIWAQQDIDPARPGYDVSQLYQVWRP